MEIPESEAYEQFFQYIDTVVGDFVLPAIGDIPSRHLSASDVLIQLRAMYRGVYLSDALFCEWMRVKGFKQAGYGWIK